MSPKPENWDDRRDLIKSLALNAAEKSVLRIIEDYAGKDDKCFPSVETIAHDAGISRSTAKRAIASLKAKKLIWIKENYRPGTKQRTSTNYFIDWAVALAYPTIKVGSNGRSKSPKVGGSNLNPRGSTVSLDRSMVNRHEIRSKEDIKTNNSADLSEPTKEAASPPEQEKLPQLSNPAEKFDPNFYAGETGEIMKFMTGIFLKAFPEIGAVPGFGSGRKADLTRIVAEFGATDVKDTWRWMCTAHHDRARFCQKTPAAIIGYLLNKPQDYIELMRADNDWYAQDSWEKLCHDRAIEGAKSQASLREHAKLVQDEEDEITRRKAAGDTTATYAWEDMQAHVAKRRAESEAERKAEVERKRKSRLESMKAWEEITGQPAVLKLPPKPSENDGEDPLEKLKRLMALRQTNAS